jgi:hypothetical protein
VSTDLILHNAKIATNGMPSQVGAIAVSDGKISASGTNGEILRLRGPATTAIDVKGRTVIPGLNDSHMHPISSIFIPTSNFPLRIVAIRRLDLSVAGKPRRRGVRCSGIPYYACKWEPRTIRWKPPWHAAALASESAFVVPS